MLLMFFNKLLVGYHIVRNFVEVVITDGGFEKGIL